MEEGYRVGEFARRAGVTVRALHHYDRLGVLRPSKRSAGGYRLYCDDDLVRLQQVVTLKTLGFELDRIAEILDAPGFDLRAALRAQIELLEDRRRRLRVAIDAIRHAERTVAADDTQRWDTFAPVIKAMIDMHDIDFSKHYTPEQLEGLRARNFSEADQSRVSEAWDRLFADIDAAIGDDPGSATSQGLVDRWDALTAEFTQNDPGLERSLAGVYSDPQNVAKATKAMPALPRAWEFIQRARAARRS